MKVDVWRNMWQDMISPFWCRRCLTTAASRADAPGSCSCFHLRCTGNAKLQFYGKFYGNYAHSHTAIFHYGHVRAPPSSMHPQSYSPAVPGWWIWSHLDHPTCCINQEALLPHISQASLICLAILFCSKSSLVAGKWSYSHISLIKFNLCLFSN